MAQAKTQKNRRSSNYWEQSRDLFNSMVLVAPLFVVYQIGVLTTGGVQNGVDFVTRFLFEIFGGNLTLYLAFNVAVLVALAIALAVLRKKSQLHPRIWGPVLLESTFYALALSSVINLILRVLHVPPHLAAGLGEMSVFSRVVLSVGAGFYEELVFRLLLFSGLVWVGKNVLKLSNWASVVGAVILSSLMFSGIHYVGALGDAFTLNSFLYRFFAGVIFAILYRMRGFAVAVYTHAIYDIFVLVVFKSVLPGG